MRHVAAVLWSVFWLVILSLVAWALGLGGSVRSSIAAGHLLDWVTGGLCLIWLLVILTVTWDLYFQTQEVAFELRSSRERGIPIVAGREEYLRALRQRLGWLAVGVHVASAAFVAAVAVCSHGTVGYYFAGFYLLSTLFRP